MKKIITIFIILCCFLLIGCSSQQEIKKRLELEAQDYINEIVMTEWLSEMRSCGVDDLTADTVLEDSYYDEESKMYRANAHLDNFKSENSINRLIKNKKEAKDVLTETLESYKSFGGKTYEWQSIDGETIKVDIHISEGSELYVADSEGKSYGIKVDWSSGEVEFLEDGQTIVLATPDAATLNTPKTKKTDSVSKNSKINSNTNTNISSAKKKMASACPFCGVNRKCSICGTKKIEYCEDYAHYCNSCWKEIRDKGYDYEDYEDYDDYDDYDSCDDCGDWDCDYDCDDYYDDYDDY